MQTFQHLLNLPEDEEQKFYGAFEKMPHRTWATCKQILKRFRNLSKFLQIVCRDVGEKAMRHLWCRIWGALELERVTGSNRTADALSHLADPDDRIVSLHHAKRGNEEIVYCVEALDQLVFA